MPDPRRSGRRRPPLQRSDLPATFTPETMRELDLATLRRLSQRNNRILSADEQRDFDMALGEVMREHTDRMQQSLRRFDPDRAEGYDPELRRSYLRTRARLAAQAERARTSFPQLDAISISRRGRRRRRSTRPRSGALTTTPEPTTAPTPPTQMSPTTSRWRRSSPRSRRRRTRSCCWSGSPPSSSSSSSTTRARRCATCAACTSPWWCRWR